jgi:hypothetical protein
MPGETRQESDGGRARGQQRRVLSDFSRKTAACLNVLRTCTRDAGWVTGERQSGDGAAKHAITQDGKKDAVCPCPEVVKEVADMGHCLCRLFYATNWDNRPGAGDVE